MKESRQEFPPDPTAVRKARNFVTKTLSGWDASAYEWQATQAVSELATNAILHARTAFVIELSLDRDSLRLSVSDGSSRKALARTASEKSTTGRGLNLISTLSQNWGISETASGKTVWCVFKPGSVGNGGGEPFRKSEARSIPNENVTLENPFTNRWAKASVA